MRMEPLDTSGTKPWNLELLTKYPSQAVDVSDDIGYVVYSALGSFYIPSCIMVFVYIRIYFAAKARARRGIRKNPRPRPNEQQTSFSNAPKGTRPMPTTSTLAMPPGVDANNSNNNRGIAVIFNPFLRFLRHRVVTLNFVKRYFCVKRVVTSHSQSFPPETPHDTSLCFPSPLQQVIFKEKAHITPKSKRCVPGLVLPLPENAEALRESQISTIETQQVAIPTVTCDFASDISTSEAGDTAAQPEERKDTLKVVTSAQVTRNPLATCPHRSSTLSVNGELALQAQRNRAPSVAIDTDMVSELEPSSSDSGVATRCAVVKPLKLRICQPIFGKKSDSSRRQEKTQPTKAELEPALPKHTKPRDPEREKRRLARKKEKRATLILGLIMGSFIACWLPFFFLYILKAACRGCVIPGSAFAIAFWLGYMNSVLNPVIYTIFNKDFRRAFRRILFK
ncbi:jg11469 [Pararge aegeria aegeria]|uniref:Jg11469 protein n=1 Tax=Pararge aegeria aegeria TaxID=348720 RepID=A0A8S4RAK2_9NEOP|nr:jg11469 [Pararge aegeria aegeria]